MSKHLDKGTIEEAFRRAATSALSDTPDARAGRYRMATVYFVRDGSGGSRTNVGLDVPLSEIVKAFPSSRAVWFNDAPTFNSERLTNDVSGYRYVVVHVRSAQPGGQLTKEGYWLLDGVSPSDFMRKFPKARRT
jgi:hypothetical protein